MKTTQHTCLALLLTVSTLLIASPKTFAASGTWTQAASGGFWSDTANWSGGTIADGSGSSAIFNTIDITADNTVHMDAAHTLTSLTFGDTDTSTAAGWTLDNNGTAGNILTLAGTTPSITVSALGTGKSVEINAVLAGTTAWSKLGAGTLTLSGANTFTGNWAVNAGTLNYNGSLTGGTQLTVNGSGANSIVNIGSGANIAFNNASVLDGDNATSGTAGAVFQTGTVTGVNQLQIGVVTGGSYGYYNLSGSAALTIAELDCGGFNGAPFGVFDITGGTLTDNNWLIVARGSGGSSLLNLTGGTVNFAGTTANRLLMNFNANASQSAVINVANASFNALNASAGILNMMNNGSAGEFAAVNLLSGGVMQIQGVKAGNTTGTSHFNFNGGTLKASTANATFLDSSVSLANVYSGGGTIDNNGVNITIAKALAAPAGNGLNGSVTINNGGSGYIGAPAVSFSGGGGTGATAYATVSGGAVTGVVITSPGINYSTTPSIVFTGGGGTGASATAPAPTANTGGGMVFQGSGTTILRGANTFGGDTTINSGTTVLTTTNTYGGNTIINGGTLKLGSALLHLSFDNVSGSTVVNDGSGGSALNGTLNGSATVVSGGMFGNCLQISGANAAAASCRVASSVVPLNVGAGNSWTVAMWVKSSTAGGCYAYQGDGAWVSGNTTFYMNNGSTTGTKAGGVRNSQGWEEGTANINDGQWHHVVMTCNGTTKTQYVDGNVDSLAVNSWNGSGTGGQFWIGGSADTGDGTANLNGDIDEVYVFNRALSQTEVQSLYNNNDISGAETILPPNTTVTVAAGATFDVSATTFTLPANLMGSGVVTGAVTTASTSKIYAGTDGTAGTLSFSNNLTMTAGSAFNLDVSTSSGSGNDLLIVGGTLTLNTTVFNLKALGGGANLDQSADYVLVSAASISGTPNATVSWVGTQPGNAAHYTVIKSGNNILLHYAATVQTPPTITSATANPTTVARGASTLITAAVTPGSGALTSVTVSGNALTGTVTLISDGGGDYTNNATIAAGAAAGNQTLTVLATDANSLTASSNITVTVSAQNDVWNGGGSDNKWTTGGNWTSGIQPASGGDSVFFDGTTQTTPNMDASFSVAALTFNSGAGSFDITNAASTLTLTGGLTNNSVNTQTLDVPVALSGAQTINAAAGNVTLNRAVSDSGAGLTLAGGGTLTLSGVNTYSGATTISSGMLAVTGSGSLGGGSYAAGIADNGSLSYSSSSAQTLSGVISGTGSLTNSGSGTVTLSAANTYGGGTTLSAGTLLVLGSSTPTSGTVTSGPLGTGPLTLNGGTFGFGGSSGYTIANSVSVAGTTSIEVASGQNEVLNGNWNGSGNLTLIANGSTGQWQFGGDNSGYTGTFTQNGGNTSLAFNSASAGSANAAWVFNNNVNQRQRLNFGTGTISFGSLSGNGSMANIAASGTATVSVGALNTSTTFSGSLGGTTTGQAQNINLLKVGAGALTLSGANTHTGTTTISAGELIGQTGGSCASSAVNVAVGATNGVKVTAANGQWTCASLAYSAGGTNYADFNFNSQVPSTTTAPLNITGNLTTNGVEQVIVGNGTFVANTAYPLITWGGTGPGDLLPFAKPIGTVGTLQLNGNTLNLKYGIYVPNIAFTNAPGVARIISVSDLVAAGLTSSQGSPNYTITVGTPVNSGVVITNSSGTLMKYTNSPSFAGNSDSYNYTVSDGTSSATATVSIMMASATGPQLATAGTDGNGHAVINFNAIPNYTYHMQHATTLAPTPDWTNLLNTITVPANGAVTWTNLESPAAGFYRLSYP